MRPDGKRNLYLVPTEEPGGLDTGELLAMDWQMAVLHMVKIIAIQRRELDAQERRIARLEAICRGGRGA